MSGQVGDVSSVIQAIIKNADDKNEISIAVAAKAINAQKQEGANAVELINSASQVGKNIVDIRA